MNWIHSSVFTNASWICYGCLFLNIWTSCLLQGFITDPYVIILSCILFVRDRHILYVLLSAFTSCTLSLVASVLLDSVYLFPDINIVSTLPWPGPMYVSSHSKFQVSCPVNVADVVPRDPRQTETLCAMSQSETFHCERFLARRLISRLEYAPSRLSATACSVYTQPLPIPVGRLFHPQPEEASCRGNRDRDRVGTFRLSVWQRKWCCVLTWQLVFNVNGRTEAEGVEGRVLWRVFGLRRWK